MPQQPLEINVLYKSGSGRETSFTAIAGNTDCLDVEHYETEAFSGLEGGFAVTLNGNHTIFQSTEFTQLTDAINFLIHSLYWVQNKTAFRFDSNDFFPNDDLIKNTGKHIIRLQSLNERELVFSSAANPGNKGGKRGNSFFDGVILNKEEWFNQADIALKEYFDVLLYVIKTNHHSNTCEAMLDYFEMWTNISVLQEND